MGGGHGDREGHGLEFKVITSRLFVNLEYRTLVSRFCFRGTAGTCIQCASMSPAVGQHKVRQCT